MIKTILPSYKKLLDLADKYDACIKVKAGIASFEVGKRKYLARI